MKIVNQIIVIGFFILAICYGIVMKLFKIE